MWLTVSGFKAPVDSTLKKNLLATLAGSNVASALSSGNSRAKIKESNQPFCMTPTGMFGMWPFFRDRINCMSKTIIRIIFERYALENSIQRCWTNGRDLLTQVGIHLACSFPKPFLACAVNRSSCPCRSLTIRMSKDDQSCLGKRRILENFRVTSSEHETSRVGRLISHEH